MSADPGWGQAESATGTALVIVDMQNDFLDPGSPMAVPNAAAVLKEVQQAIRLARRYGVKVIYTKAGYRGDGVAAGPSARFFDPVARGECLVAGSQGAQIHSEISPRDADVVIDKRRYSAFYDTNLEIRLRRMHVSSVVIAGVTTENCCHATARDAMFRGYDVTILADATGAYEYRDDRYGAVSAEDVQRVTLAVLAGSTGRVLTTRDWGREIGKQTGTRSLTGAPREQVLERQ